MHRPESAVPKKPAHAPAPEREPEPRALPAGSHGGGVKSLSHTQGGEDGGLAVVTDLTGPCIDLTID